MRICLLIPILEIVQFHYNDYMKNKYLIPQLIYPQIRSRVHKTAQNTTTTIITNNSKFLISI